MAERFPLSWPSHRARTPENQRKRAEFGKKSDAGYKVSLSVADAVRRLEFELDAYTPTYKPYRIPKESVIISTNVAPGVKGRPLSNMAEPKDPGVAVYFNLDGIDYCLPCDKFTKVADNIAAIAAHINALRGIERWGVGESRDVYTGFKALPQNAGSSSNAWWDILGIPSHASVVEIKEAYKLKKIYYHPDKATGNETMFKLITMAYQEAMKQNGQDA